MATVTDGTGTQNRAKVDGANRLHVYAINKPSDEEGTERGDSFNVNTGLVTLTTADEQGIAYLKNNESRDLHINAIVAILGPSTGGDTSDTTRIRIYKNPTTGTLISEATNVDTNSNRNFSSSTELSVDAYKGDGSSTVTDGTVHIESMVNPGNRLFFDIDEILSNGDSIAVTYEPNDSNTSMKTMAAIICHLSDPDE